MKIEASTRLVTANADVEKAKEFIKSVTGVQVTKVVVSSPISIHFEFPSDKVVQATKLLTKRYGKPDRSTNILEKDDKPCFVYLWKFDGREGGHYINLFVAKDGSYCEIMLEDYDLAFDILKKRAAK